MAMTVPARMSGILRPDPRLTWWSAESGQFDAAGTKEGELGEASPVAGIPVPTAATDLALRAAGAQEGALDVLCNRAGLPVLDGLGYLCRADGGTDDDWMGCDLPVPLGGWQSVSTLARYTPHVIRLGTERTDTKAMVVHAQATGEIASQTCTDGGAWSGEVAIDSAAVADPHPCLLRLPSGRVLCYRWADDGTDHQVRAWYTDDDGVTWTAIGPVLTEVLDAAAYPLRFRLRAVYLDGAIALFGHVQAAAGAATTYRDRIVQWASSDGGYTLERVLISTGLDPEHAGGWPEVCTWRGEIVLARLTWGAASGVEARIRRLSTAWYPWTSAEELAVTGGLTSGSFLGLRSTGGPGDYFFSEGELALWADDDGAIYLTGRHCADAQDGASPILRSVDGGTTWLAPGSSLLYAGRGQAWYWTGSAAEEARSITACAVLGHTVAVYDPTRTAAATRLLHAAWLGGWQSVPMPSVNQQISPTRRIAWHHVGTADQLPNECGWTLATVGAPTITLTAACLYHQTAAGESVTYSIVPSGTLAQGILDEHALEVVSGEARIRLYLQDATPQDFDAQIRVTPTTVRLWDDNAGAYIGATYTYAGGPVAIRVSMEGDAIRLFARAPGDAFLLASSAELCGQARAWTEVAKTAALTAGGGGGANTIAWQTTASSEVYWYWWCHASGAYCGDHLYTQPTRQKFPRSLCESPSSAILSVRLSSVSGPGVVGDRWDVPPSAEYPYAALLPSVSPSPRHRWRSTVSPTQIGAAGPTGRLSWQIRGTPEQSMGALWGVLVDGLSMGGVQVMIRPVGAWQLAGSVGYWTFIGTIAGRTLEVSSGGVTYSAVLRRDELAGCLVDVLDNAATESLERAIVVRNDPGHIDTTAGASLPLRIELDRAPASPSPAKIRIYPRRALLLLDLSLSATVIRGIQIRWPIPRHPVMTPVPLPGPSPLGYHEMATVAPGPVWPSAVRHSWGRRLATEVDTELITAEDGTRTAYQRAPARRRLSATWSDPVSMHDLESHAPDTIGYGTGKPPLAFRRFTPIDLADILRALAGSATPIVWCEAIDAGSSGRPDHWADGAFVGRITSAIERDLVLGDEERDPAERVQDLTIEEEV